MAKSFSALVLKSTTKQTQEKATARTKQLLSRLLLSEIRKRSGQSQTQVAASLGMKQPSLSKLEKQSDMQLSTLRKIIQALGGELEVVAKFPQGRVALRQFNSSSKQRG